MQKTRKKHENCENDIFINDVEAERVVNLKLGSHEEGRNGHKRLEILYLYKLSVLISYIAEKSFIFIYNALRFNYHKNSLLSCRFLCCLRISNKMTNLKTRNKEPKT